MNGAGYVLAISAPFCLSVWLWHVWKKLENAVTDNHTSIHTHTHCWTMEICCSWEQHHVFATISSNTAPVRWPWMREFLFHRNWSSRILFHRCDIALRVVSDVKFAANDAHRSSTTIKPASDCKLTAFRWSLCRLEIILLWISTRSRRKRRKMRFVRSTFHNY